VCAKIFQQGGAKSSKIAFSSLETKKTIFFAKILMGKYQTSKSWGSFTLLLTPMPLKLHMTKKLKKITKIYLPISR